MQAFKTNYDRWWYYSIMTLLVVQYLRPQTMVGSLENAPIFLLVALFVIGFIVLSSNFKLVLNTYQTQLTAAIIVWFILLLPFSYSMGASVKGFQSFFPLLPFVLAMPLLLTNTRRLHKVVDIFIALASIISLIALVQGQGGRYNLFSFGNFLTDPNDYALFMLTILPVAYFMFLYESKISLRKYFYLLATILTLTSVIISYSRGGFLGLLAVFTIIWIVSPNKLQLLVITIIGLIGIIFLVSDQWIELIKTATDTTQSTAQTRLITWIASYNVFLDNPWGVGLNNLGTTMHLYDFISDNPERWWGNVNHSFWLTILAEGGVVGAFIIASLIYVNLSQCRLMFKRSPTNESQRFLAYFGRGYLAAFVGFLISGTFLTVNYYPHFWYMTGLIAAAYMIFLKERRKISAENVQISGSFARQTVNPCGAGNPF